MAVTSCLNRVNAPVPRALYPLFGSFFPAPGIQKQNRHHYDHRVWRLVTAEGLKPSQTQSKIFFENLCRALWNKQGMHIRCFLQNRALEKLRPGVEPSGDSMTFCHVQYNGKLTMERCSDSTGLQALNHSESSVTQHHTHGPRWTLSPAIWPSPVCWRHNSDRFPGTLWGCHYWVSQRSQNSPLSSAGGLERGQIPGHSSSIWTCINKRQHWNVKFFGWGSRALISRAPRYSQLLLLLLVSMSPILSKGMQSFVLTLARDSLWLRTSRGSSHQKGRRWESWGTELWWWAAAQLGNKQTSVKTCETQRRLLNTTLIFSMTWWQQRALHF